MKYKPCAYIVNKLRNVLWVTKIAISFSQEKKTKTELDTFKGSRTVSF